jgi:hypothetical protein
MTLLLSALLLQLVLVGLQCCIELLTERVWSLPPAAQLKVPEGRAVRHCTGREPRHGTQNPQWQKSEAPWMCHAMQCHLPRMVTDIHQLCQSGW